MFAGVILAGGQARRMGGRDKGLLRLGGVAMIEHLAARLSPQLDHLALSANGDPQRFAWLGLPVLADAEPGFGPLAGIARGLAWAQGRGCDALLTVPCDTPFVPDNLLARLCPAPAVAMSGKRLHHAVALWPIDCGGRLRTYLRVSERRSIRDFARTLAIRPIDFDAEEGGGEEDKGGIDPFFNINTSLDLAQAEILLARPCASPRARPPG